MAAENQQFDAASYVDTTATCAYDVAETDGGLAYPRQYDRAGSEHGTPVEAIEDLQAGDRILWGDRSMPCTVARVVTPEDRVGQALTASVLKRVPPAAKESDPAYGEPEYGRDLGPGDVFLNPNSWGTLTGTTFVLVHGPRGGFYAFTESNKHSGSLVTFRAVRSYHSTRMGRPGQGAWAYDCDGPDRIEVVEHGEAPEELDEAGDLPAYEDIADKPVVAFDQDVGEHYEVGTVAEVFDEGLHSAHERAAAEFKARTESAGEDDEADAWDADVPDADRVEGTPDGAVEAHVVVTEVFRSEGGPRAVVETPAPWETPDGVKPANEVIKSTPYRDVQYKFESDREAWTLAATELTKVASVFRDHGYAVAVADGVLDG